MKKTVLITILFFIFFYGHSNDAYLNGGTASDLRTIMEQYSYLIIDGEYTIDENLTIPENIIIDFRIDGKFNISLSNTVFFNGSLRAGEYQIFTGEGVVSGNPKVEKIYPQWWGADGTDDADDTDAIQAAINLGNIVFLPYPKNGKNRYRVHGTLFLDDNTTFIAEPGVIIRGKFTEVNGNADCADRHGYPNTIINANSKNNVRIENIIFNFDKSCRDSIGYGKSIPGIHFTDCQNISFENVTLQQFMTDKDTLNPHSYCVAIFERCDDITINKLKQYSINEEGIRFFDCKSVNLTNSEGSPGGVTISSFFGFWRCDGVLLKNTRIQAAPFGGSVVNCYSRNVLIENLRMFSEDSNGTEIHGGRGIDLANEAGVDQYDCYNITIRNCYLKCKRYGIQGGAYPDSYGSDILTIDNNYIDVEEDGNFLQGIRVDNAQTVNITNNRIILDDASNSTNGKCIWISSNRTANKKVKGIKIENNDMRGLCGIGYYGSAPINLNLLSIKNNLFTSQDLEDFDPEQGASTFLFLGQMDSPLTFDNILLENNVVDNIGGGFFVVKGEDISLGNISIIRNTFKGRVGNDVTNSNCKRFMKIINSNTSSLKSTLRILDNNFYEAHSLRVDNFENIFISSNLVEWTSSFPAPVNFMRIRNCSKTLNITENIILGSDYGSYSVDDYGSDIIPEFINISRNLNIDENGNKIFSVSVKYKNTGFPYGQVNINEIEK